MNHAPSARAQAFRQLHDAGEPLVLPNAWDAASARIIEKGGARAVATSSAAMAWALGHPDGEQLPLDDLLTATRRIIEAVDVPVSIDIERGYGEDAEDTGGLVGALIQLGAVGINIEDGKDPSTGQLADARILVERIACIRAVAEHRGVPLFINARTDSYITPGLTGEARFKETLERALAYVDAGADGIFVPGLADAGEIERLAAALPVPLNVYVGYPGAPGVATLRGLGVRRISLGCGTMQAVLAHLARITEEALVHGRFELMGSHMLGVGEVNGLFASSQPRVSTVRRSA
ncbi:isocitrate lyase/PEP mutase family protein [Dyella telluris]|uniref:Isocitrate lyase/phosphoenolpyruvate mutase family protein n=1 Tax=Dyella telluris TaxID=2763498 RepID=A0A7G8Q8N6_9GAMM|nr:isocitrate lyase/phosphoenolpyruvate mutase family protein [Dyella telluris]QNK03144.1 isocitrate lyase/phosphoenolpyruvate mutase family protein [Dyella telluris]